MATRLTDKTDPTNTAAQLRPYKVARVEKILAPEGAASGNWYRYVLDNGRAPITGQRKGSLKDVTSYAARYAEQLNARRKSTQSAWAPRSSKTA